MLLWWLSDDPLDSKAKAAIRNPESEVFVSAATVWEIAIKRSLGKLDAPSDIEEQLAAGYITPLSITLSHAWMAGDLPRHHDDPFDRILIAQAILEGLTVVTRDPRIRLYDVPVLFA